MARFLDAIRKIACKLCGSAVVQTPDTSINILSGSDITYEELYSLLSNYTKNVYIRDAKYHTINLPKFWEYLKINPVSKRKYVPERHDCIDEETSVVISFDGVIDVLQVSDLMPPEYPLNQRYPLYNTYIYSKGGFTKINWLVKKTTDKPMIRMYGRGVADVTSDHKVFKKDGSMVRASEICNGDDIDTDIPVEIISRLGNLDYYENKYDQLPWEKGVNEDVAWVYGLFCAEGSCTRKMIRVVVADKNIVDRFCRIVDDQLHNIKTVVRLYDTNRAGAHTNFGERKRDLYCIDLNLEERHNNSYMTDLCAKVKYMFYSSTGKKRVPLPILHAKDSIVRSFIEGYIDGDGHVKNNTNAITTTNSNILCNQIEILKAKVGIGGCVGKSHNCFSNSYNSRVKPRKFKAECISKAKRYVYDINTDSGMFYAGNILVKNCDDYSLELFYSTCHSHPLAAMGIVWGIPRSEGIKGHHAWNFIVTSDKKVMWVEPQNDGVWAPGKDDEVSMMLI